MRKTLQNVVGVFVATMVAVCLSATFASSKIEVSENSKNLLRTTIQPLLAELGYYDGPIDGVMGRKTRTAIYKFEFTISNRADGYLEESELEALKQAVQEKRGDVSDAPNNNKERELEILRLENEKLRLELENARLRLELSEANLRNLQLSVEDEATKTTIVEDAAIVAEIGELPERDTKLFYGLFRPRGDEFSSWDCQSVGQDGGAIEVREGKIHGTESLCKLSNPSNLEAATIWDAECAAEGYQWSEQVMLAPSPFGVHFVTEDYIADWQNCDPSFIPQEGQPLSHNQLRVLFNQFLGDAALDTETQPSSEMPEAKTGLALLQHLEKWQPTIWEYWHWNGKCRGTSGNHPDLEKICESRSKIAATLEENSWCQLDDWKWAYCAVGDGSRLPIKSILPQSDQEASALAEFKREISQVDVTTVKLGHNQISENADWAAAFATWLPLAERSNPEAQYEIGRLYLSGLGGVPRDELIAWHWISRSAEGGYVQAYSQLGNIYKMGLGVEANSDEAGKWFALAAKHSASVTEATSEMQDNQGTAEISIPERGTDVVELLEKELEETTREAEERARVDRSKIEKLESELKHLAEALAKQESETKRLDQESSVAKAEIERLQIALENEKGEGLKKLLALATSGDADAQFRLGALYLEGQELEKSKALAIKWFRQAAKKGHADSQYSLGKLSPNRSMKFKWFTLAAQQGHEEAKAALIQVEKEISEREVARKEAEEQAESERLAAEQAQAERLERGRREAELITSEGAELEAVSEKKRSATEQLAERLAGKREARLAEVSSELEQRKLEALANLEERLAAEEAEREQEDANSIVAQGRSEEQMERAYSCEGFIPTNFSDSEQFWEKASTNNIRYCLNGKSPIHKRANDGMNPIHFAARFGNLVVLDYMLSVTQAVDTKDYNGYTALHYAAEGGFGDVVEYLLQAGANSGAQSQNGVAPIHWASAQTDTSALNALLRAGADATLRAASGDTPLHYAGRWGGESTIQALIDAGADVNAQDVQGATPLFRATMDANRDAIRALLNAGANPNIGDGLKTPIFALAEYVGPLGTGDAISWSLLLKAGADPNVRAQEGFTPLHVAAMRGTADAVDALLDAGADPNAKLRNGACPRDLIRGNIALTGWPARNRLQAATNPLICP